MKYNRENEELILAMTEVWQVRKPTGPHKRGLRETHLDIECPYCGWSALVDKEWAAPKRVPLNDGTGGSVLIVGRSCTYCSKTPQLPERAPGGKPRGA